MMMKMDFSMMNASRETMMSARTTTNTYSQLRINSRERSRRIEQDRKFHQIVVERCLGDVTLAGKEFRDATAKLEKSSRKDSSFADAQN